MRHGKKKIYMILSLIIPVYNEDSSVEKLIRTVISVPIKKELVIVNDGSRDKSKEILERLKKEFSDKLPEYVNRIKVIHKEKNEGKGAAIRTGIKHATGDVITIQDADLELDPFEFSNLMEPFEKRGADIVFGSRFHLAWTRRVFPLWKKVVPNRILTGFSNMLSGIQLTDMEVCYKAFRRELIQSFHLEADRFGIEPELAAKAAKCVHAGKAMYEIPISYYPRTNEQGKKIGVMDGIKALWEIIKYNLFRGL